MNETTPRLVAAKALSLLDLTDLSDSCDTAAIEKLCQQANTPFGTTAAICIWPRFVSQARTLLGPDSRNANFGIFAAGTLLTAIPTVSVFLWLQRYIVSGLTMGAVKG